MGLVVLWQGDDWLLLSWQIVLKAIEDISAVIKKRLIDPWEVLRWIYLSYTHTLRHAYSHSAGGTTKRSKEAEKDLSVHMCGKKQKKNKCQKKKVFFSICECTVSCNPWAGEFCCVVAWNRQSQITRVIIWTARPQAAGQFIDVGSKGEIGEFLAPVPVPVPSPCHSGVECEALIYIDDAWCIDRNSQAKCLLIKEQLLLKVACLIIWWRLILKRLLNLNYGCSL